MTTGEQEGVAEQFQDAAQQWRADSFGMWVFLATEAMMFGGLFLAFAVYRFEFPAAFAEAAHHLKLPLGVANTILLMTSGFFMAMSDVMLERRRRRFVLLAVLATMILGSAFLGLKGYEYFLEYEEGLIPFLGLAFDDSLFGQHQARMFFVLYFLMTGLHALHMLIGIGLMAVLFILVWRWRDPVTLTRQGRIIALYWAFVDVVWLLLFPTLYLLGSGG